MLMLMSLPDKVASRGYHRELCVVYVKLICSADVAGQCQTMTLLKHITARPL